MHPPNPSVSQQDVAGLAYRFWEEAGRPDGRDQEFWFLAEQQLNALTKATGSTVATDKRPAQARVRRKRHD
ncbi:MAG: DUF2934 domain-containing protein [Verrucomicrobia bacterium]|nr:DUF2934 domain-containing protein [Verrucomicrobiota bacterium]